MTIPKIVSLEQAVAHLRTTVGDFGDEADLQLKVDAATQLVCEYISDRNPADPTWVATIEAWGTSGSPLTPPPAVVVAAILFQIGELSRFRGDDFATDKPHPYAAGSLHPFVQTLLQRYRQPVLA